MTKYFYTDPLAAAWMAKHFSMKLELRYTPEEIAEYEPGTEAYFFENAMIDDGIAEMWEDVIAAGCRRIYIHTDSLPLLKPKRWDVMTDRGKNSVGFVMTSLPDLTVIQSSTENAEQVLTRVEIYPAGFDSWRIIQRDGKPFFWPESE